MKTEAILLALFGLISTALTAPPVTKASKMPEPLDKVPVKSADGNSQTTTQQGRLQHLQEYCGRSSSDAGCLAYKEMIASLDKSRASEIDQIIEKKLAQTLSKNEAENFCGNLSQTLRRLPLKSATPTLEQLKSLRECVTHCYTNENEQKPTAELKDVCRAVNIGYEAILQSVDGQKAKYDLPAQAAGALQSESAIKPLPLVTSAPVSVDQKSPDANVGNPKLPVSATNNGTEKAAKMSDPAGVESVIVKDAVPEITNKERKPDVAEVPAEASKAVKPQEKAPPQVDPPLGAANPVEDDSGQPQDESDGDGEDMGQFADGAKPAGDQGGKDTTNSQYVNDSDETMQDANDTEDDLKGSELHSVGEKAKMEEKPIDSLPRSPPIFFGQKDSNFFSYFLFAMFSCAVLYVAYHNKSKLLALVVEGRRTSNGRGGFSKGRKHTAAYRKLDSNLEEAITSGSTSGGHSSTQIIY